MSLRLRGIVLLWCLGSLVCGVWSAGFSASLTQTGGSAPLANGANSVNTGSGVWSTSGLAGFTDGQFQADGGYIIPVGGNYHFDGVIQVEVNTVDAPLQTVALRLVKCANGCNALCTGGSVIAQTLVQSGTIYLSQGFTAAFPPTYSLSVAFSGAFNTGDLIAMCVDSEATSGAVRILCPSNAPVCAFSGAMQ